MSRFLITACLLFGLIKSSQGQIYADVEVSYGSTSLGTFRIQLHHDLAPRTVANFIGLATGQRAWIDPGNGILQVDRPYYDGLIFHRLIHNFMIQGGDPLGTGMSGPGYVFQDEFHPSLSHVEYAVSMANSGPLSNGSQFFINLSSPTALDNKHSIFGIVINDATYPNGRSLIDGFKSSVNFPTSASDSPDTPITIDSVTISGPDLAAFGIHDPTLGLPTVSPLPLSISQDAATRQFSLGWEAKRQFDYPLYFGTDLQNWSLAGKIFSMDDNPAYEIDIDGIATTAKAFYQSTQIDYTWLTEAPQNILADGTQLDFTTDGGTLRINFDGAGSGTWRFIYSNGTTADDSGSITSSSQTTSSISSYPLIPANGVFINKTGQTYSRFISLRQSTVYIDGDAGPNLITAVQPVLSFHESSGGWYDGAANSGTPTTFRGQFIITTD